MLIRPPAEAAPRGSVSIKKTPARLTLCLQPPAWFLSEPNGSENNKMLSTELNPIVSGSVATRPTEVFLKCLSWHHKSHFS